MAPNKTVAAFRAKVGKKPEVIVATNERVASEPMVVDMEKFQRGEMTHDEFMKKWGECRA